MSPFSPSPSRRWLPRYPTEPDPAAVAALARSLRLPQAICRVLVQRGYAGEALAKRFLRPPMADLHDPASLADIDPAVERIARAIRQRETILVHGDYDVDGMCAAALLTRVLQEVGADVHAFVPHRTRDGYDLGSAGVAQARRVGARLLVTADCGILAHEAVESARRAGVDVVVTDHHTPGSTLPAAHAAVNPRRADCAYPEKGLCGTGVAFKVCQAVVSALGRDPEPLRWHLDLVALATVADIMPLTGENRILVHYGLRVLAQTRNPGLAALVASAGLASQAPLTAGQLSHVLGPRLNAVGRLDDAGVGLRLLLTDTSAEAASIAARLEEVNARRQRVDREILGDALDLLEHGFEPSRDHAVVLAGTAWHPGVIGIVASRVVERIHRPTILLALAEDGGLARGSGRSIPGFDLVGGLRECAVHLERFGGHRQAAGLDIHPDRIEAFREAFGDVARRRLAPEQLVPATHYDLEIGLPEATAELCGFLRYLGPFGAGNPAPVFLARGVRVDGSPRVVGQDHLRLRLAQGDARVAAIGFRMASVIGDDVREGALLDVAFQLQEDEWNGRRRIQAKLVDLRPTLARSRPVEPEPIPVP